MRDGGVNFKLYSFNTNKHQLKTAGRYNPVLITGSYTVAKNHL